MYNPFDSVIGTQNKSQKDRDEAISRCGGIKYPHYVTMTVAEMSTSPHGKTFKLVFCCTNSEQAMIVSENARSRGDMKAVTFRPNGNIPTYPKKTHSTRYVTPDAPAYARWYTKGAF